MCRVMATDVVLIITGQQLGRLRGGKDVVDNGAASPGCDLGLVTVIACMQVWME